MSVSDEHELSDIELCYKAMGLSFSDNPQKVESVYLKLKDEYGRKMRSSDPGERTGASDSLKQLEELFQTITGSLIYKDYAREYEKYKAAKAEQIQQHRQKQSPVVKEALVNCPYCHKPIITKLKVCIYCHGKIMTPMELMIDKFLCRRNIIIGFVLLLVVCAAVFVALNPQLLKR